MNELEQYKIFADLIGFVIISSLIVVLAFSMKKLTGKKWLMAYAVLSFIGSLIFHALQLIARYFPDNRLQLYQWYDVTSLIYPFAIGCLALFIFANWSKSRMHVDPIQLLFSYKGRIPRSAFWIAHLIITSIWWRIGVAPLSTKSEGIIIILLWIIYTIWLGLSIWIGFALYTKRWHDCGKSGWMSVVMFIPIIGSLYLLGYTGFVRGTVGTNIYGDDPLIANED